MGKILLKQYKTERVEVASKEVILPTEVSYYFETNIRRSIKITPKYTTWNKEHFDKEEEMYELEVVCLYQDFECRAEKFALKINELEKIYYTEKHKDRDFVYGLFEGWFDKRTKEQFEADLNNVIEKLQR